MSEVVSPLWLSLRIAIVATVMAALLALPLAFGMARRRFAGKHLIEAMILAPLVLPPTVIGYVIIMLLGAQGCVGSWLYAAFDYSIVFRFEGAVLAAAVVAFPMLYMPFKAGFASVDRDLIDAARVMGASGMQVFWHVSLPLARCGVASGLVLGFARALGEFGATIMVFGWQPGRVTLPISIYAEYEQGAPGNAAPAVLVLSAISLVLILLYNHVSVSGWWQK